MDLLCLEFVNSKWYITHKPYADPLTDRNWMLDFSGKWNLNIHNTLSEKECTSLMELRELLSNAVETIYDYKEISQEQIRKINDYSRLSPLYLELERSGNAYSKSFKPFEDDLNYVLGKIAQSFIDLISEYDFKRIKQCSNPKCKWVYIDESKNNTRKWCCNTCASLIKVRNFRNKGKAT